MNCAWSIISKYTRNFLALLITPSLSLANPFIVCQNKKVHRDFYFVLVDFFLVFGQAFSAHGILVLNYYIKNRLPENRTEPVARPFDWPREKYLFPINAIMRDDWCFFVTLYHTFHSMQLEEKLCLLAYTSHTNDVMKTRSVQWISRLWISKNSQYNSCNESVI